MPIGRYQYVMTRISQIISVVGGVKSDVTHQVEALEGAVVRDELLSGISKTYRTRSVDSQGQPVGAQLPPQSTRVQVTAEETLDKVSQLYARLLDVTRTLDEANAGAAGDVVVDGQVLLPQVASSHLLFLARELGNLYSFVAKIPTLDQAETWTDEGTEQGQWKTPPVERERTDQVPYNHVLAEADDRHPKQVQVMARNEVVGYWTTVKFSGALDPRRKRQLLDRLTQLQEAVKFAREEANAAEAADVREGSKIFGWWLRP